MRHSLESTGDGMTARLVGKIGHEVGHIDIGLVARGENMTDGRAAFHRLRHGLGQGAGLAGDADGHAARLPRRRVFGKCDARATTVVGDPETVGTEDLQSGFNADRS